MRTTIDLDDTLLERLRDEAHRLRIPFRALLHRVLQRGLEVSGAEPALPYRTPTASFGRVREGIDLVKARHVAAALDDEIVARRLGDDR